MNLTSPSAIREILSRRGIRLKKELGQHFLADGNVLRKILAAIDPKGDEIAVEVGAGIGTLTCALAPRVRRLYAVEIDRRLVSILRDHCTGFSNVQVIPGDFLELPLESLDSGLLVAGNLPYAITSEVLLKLVREREQVSRAVFLIQWEVARKLVAPPGPERSRLGVHLSAYYGLELLFRVPRGAFFPPPEVDGGVVRLVRLAEPRISTPEKVFEEALRVLFSARRKTLRRVLSSRFGREAAEALIAELGLDPGVRAESLPLEALDRIAAWLHSRGLLAAQ